ncbi:MAG: N-acetyl sugar amidotransferase [Coxiellaceae bacterium]|jgi:N-acetyl sugar amidotransferase|nr:N-acetyl sugar amidotransferase [Coxiellaceae bacterium]
MKYCKKCLQPDTRPNTLFSEDGICPACIYTQATVDVDWQEREAILLDLIQNIPRNKRCKFDCIVGVSGGKDSTRQAVFVRDKLKLNPLLVCISYPPQQVTERGVNNISNLINLGFDCTVVSPAPETWRQLMKHGFEKFTNWGRSTELALFSGVPQQAIHYGIALILWGENPGLQVGDLKTLGRTCYDGNNIKNMNTLSGGTIDWILERNYKISDLNPYRYPTAEEFAKHNIQIIYLGWFLKDWSAINNGVYSCLNGLQIRNDCVVNTGDLYGVYSLDEDWVTINQMIKYYKFGFGRTTDYVNEEIRLGRMSRNKGIELVEKYDHCCSNDYIKSFCEYIGISVDYFWEKVRSSVNKKLFSIESDGKIVRKFEVGVGL